MHLQIQKYKKHADTNEYTNGIWFSVRWRGNSVLSLIELLNKWINFKQTKRIII